MSLEGTHSCVVVGVEIQSSTPVEVVAEDERVVDCCAVVVGVGIVVIGSLFVETFEYFESIDGQLDGSDDFPAD